MAEIARDSAPESREQSPGAIMALPRARGMRRAEWTAIRDRARIQVREAHTHLEHARQVHEATKSPTSRMALARAQRRSLSARRYLLLLRVLWSTGARLHEVLGIRFELMEWFDDGKVRIVLMGKAAPTPTADDTAEKRPREAILLPDLTAALLEWIMTCTRGVLPTEGPLWAVDRERAPSPDAVERYLHQLACEAGVQRYQGPSPHNRKPGMDKRSHKYLITTHAIRELSERVVIPKVGAEIAARSAGHSVRTQRQNYFRAGTDEAELVANARGD